MSEDYSKFMRQLEEMFEELEKDPRLTQDDAINIIDSIYDDLSHHFIDEDDLDDKDEYIFEPIK
ncbi:hypothetical protein [Alkalihalobacillus sp. 1P02AB]|uniref:hypothetical protein n=1 Tax=Alkalihalobacillus sp. 1P02AB TaxID=3132260 RepID=UPI0039A76892